LPIATNIPPHQLPELIHPVFPLTHNPHITIPQLIDSIPPPHFPTPRLILPRTPIRRAYQTRRRSIILPANVEIQEKPDPKQTIIVTQLPYQVN
ncbi:DNA gyrase subunit A, partial [Bacillus mycoides]|uniref:DNA gyrase subunit A n=1 Tax=Bacillus mycoides TaxID=1405 RepID=UPI00235305A7